MPTPSGDRLTEAADIFARDSVRRLRPLLTAGLAKEPAHARKWPLAWRARGDSNPRSHRSLVIYSRIGCLLIPALTC